MWKFPTSWCTFSKLTNIQRCADPGISGMYTPIQGPSLGQLKVKGQGRPLRFFLAAYFWSSLSLLTVEFLVFPLFSLIFAIFQHRLQFSEIEREKSKMNFNE